MTGTPTRLERLIERLKLKRAEPHVFQGGSGAGGVTADNRLFGGLVMAQAAVAAAMDAQPRFMHSLHGYFIRPARPNADITFSVHTYKAGKTYRTSHVTATQNGKPIVQLTASFTNYSTGIEHTDAMPITPPPDALPNRDAARGRQNWQDGTIDIRLCDPLTGNVPLPPEKSVWMRPFGAIPDDPLIHLGLLVFASDRAFLSTAWRPHADKGSMQGVSLDHAMWFHEPPRFDDWLLYHSHSPAAAAGRGLVQGAIYKADGVRIATVAQEGTMQAATKH